MEWISARLSCRIRAWVGERGRVSGVNQCQVVLQDESLGGRAGRGLVEWISARLSCRMRAWVGERGRVSGVDQCQVVLQDESLGGRAGEG